MPVGFARSLFSQGVDTRLITSQATVSATETVDQTVATTKIGDGAARCNGTAARITITINSPDGGFSFTGSQKFTIEFWMRHNVLSGNERELLRFTNNSNDVNRIRMIGASGSSGSLSFFNASTQSQNTTAITYEVFTHVAMVCHGDNTFDGYVAGTRRVTNASFFTASTKTFLIGQLDGSGGGEGVIIDELRVSNNERYTSASYTPSTTQYTADANTIALFHFDQNQPSGVYTDYAYTS